MVASAQMKFASKARLRSVFPFGNREPTCMQLPGHFMDIEGLVLVYHTKKYQPKNEVCIRSKAKSVVPFGNAEPTLFLCHYLDTLWTLGG